jgi:O-succinylhomoserine sulfhydrylase
MTESPFNAWVLSKSLETLAVRMDRHCDNAEKLAHFLSSHPKIKSVIYPFWESHPQFDLAHKQMKRGGGLVTLEVQDGIEQARRVVNQVQMITRSSNLGDSRTIITHPATTTHAKQTFEEREKAGIAPGTLRVSVGLEEINDIIDDLDQALELAQ